MSKQEKPEIQDEALIPDELPLQASEKSTSPDFLVQNLMDRFGFTQEQAEEHLRALA